MSDELPFTPDATLDLVPSGWWLELGCACGRTTQVPHRMLAERHGARAYVPGLLTRLRCRTCGKPPRRAEWVGAPVGPPHYPEPQRVPLRLPLAASP